ncbi:hypothetical protein [Trinickia dinghuensis]|nr:hypothetical protein [Trinickia dinghuensis]
MEIKSVHTCLGRLKDAGLIREKDRGRFQRIDVKEPSVAVVSLEVVSPTAPALVEETAAPSRRPFDILADAAAALNLLAEQIRNTAGELETAALEIENEFAKESEALEKLKQFQTLLKSLT